MKKVNAFLLLLFVFATSGCVPQPTLEYKPPLQKQGEIFLYLQPLPQEAHALTFRIADISLVAENDSLIPLLDSLPPLQGRELIGLQKRLTAKIVEPGTYKALSITIDKASLLGEEGESSLLVSDKPIIVQQDITVLRNKAKALFLSLAPEKQVTDGFRFTPEFALVKLHRQPNLIGFISNTRGNTVSVFNKRTMQIIDVIATGPEPQGLTLDQNIRRVYVASTGKDEIAAMDIGTGDILGIIKLHFGDDPIEIVLSADGRTLLSANHGSNTVSIVDTNSMTEVGRINLDSEPSWLVAGRSGQQAYVLQEISNRITVVDFSRNSVVGVPSLDETPVRSALSPSGRELYVITRRSPDLLVIDLPSLTITCRIFVGNRAAALTVDSKTGLVYVGKKSGEIAVVEPLSLMFIDQFFVAGDAGFMSVDIEENSLYVLSDTGSVLQKVDLVSKKGSGALATEAGSYGVVTMGER
jgi:YVTN family beta-propeller protein